MATDVGSAVGYLDLDISGFLAGLKSAQSEADTASKNIATKIGNNLQSAGKSMTSAGSTLTKTVTAPILGLGTVTVKVTSDFESAMSKVSAISSATGDDLDALNKKAQEMGAKTKFSATESAEAFTYMAMAGWKTQDMLDGIDGIMNLAAADGLDLATTSDIVTDALTAFGLSASDSGHFADVLAKASSNANTNVSMLGESFKYAAPVAGALGYSAEDTAIALGLMANAGIKGSQGGTALRGSLTRLIKPTDDAAVLMEQYGLSMTNADGSMKNLGEVMNMLRDRLGGLTEAEQAQVAAQIFGQEAMSGMLSIINASDSDYAKLTDAIYDADGAAQQMADTMLDNLSGQLTLLKSALEGLAIQFGEILMPYIKQFVVWLQNLTQKLQELTPEQKEQIVQCAAIVASIGPLLLILGKLVSGIGTFIVTIERIPVIVSTISGSMTTLVTAFKNVGEGITLAKAGFPALASQASTLGAALGSITAPVIAVIAVITTLIGVFVTLWNTSESFRNQIIDIFQQIKETFGGFLDGIVERINALGFDFESFGDMVWTIWKGFCDLLGPFITGTLQNIANVIKMTFDIILGVLDIFVGIFTGDWDRVWSGIKGIFVAIWDYVVSYFKVSVDTLKSVADVVCGWFGTTWENTWNNIKQFFINTWSNITTFFVNVKDSITNAVSNFVSNVVNFFKELPDNITLLIMDVLHSITTWSVNMVNKAREMGINFITSVSEFFDQLPYKIGYFIGKVLTSIILWRKNMINNAKEMGTNFVKQIVEFFIQLPGKVLRFITSTFDNVHNWSVNMVKKAKETGTNFINQIVVFFSQLPGKVLQFVIDTLNNVITWSVNMKAKAIEAAQGFLNNVVDIIVNLPSRMKQFLDEAISNLAKWVVDMGVKGKESVTNLIDNVLDTASDIPSKVASIGSDIVNGVWSGIEDAKDDFVTNVTDFFTGIVDGVKDALEIGSPSKVFRDEIGRWLPPGVAEGFEAAMPSAMKAIQKDLNKGIDGIDVDDISVGAGITVSGFADKLKSIYNEVALWFESIESRIGNSVDSMMQSLDMLIRAGQVIVNSDGTLGYVGYNGFTKTGGSEGYVDRINPKDNNNRGNGDTFIFNSPKAIDEIEAAKQMKKTKQDMAEGF